jgi:hypothetical protein
MVSEIGLIAVVTVAGVEEGRANDTAGVFDVTLYQSTLATVPTVKLVDVRPGDE